CNVVGVYPQGKKPLFKLTFDADESIYCCAEHLWVYQHPRARYPYRQSHHRRERNPFYGEWTVVNTATILAQVGPHPTPLRRVVMPQCGAWQFKYRPIPVDPYLLGLLLGDGCLIRGTDITSADAEIVESCRRLAPSGVGLICKTKYGHRFVGQPR